MFSMDDAMITVTVEPVEVALEKDGSLLLSSLQAAVPGSHGIYFYENGRKKAIKYDGVTAKLLAPVDGWGTHHYFLTLAHCGRLPWTHFSGKYETATSQFERSVQSIQKLLTGVGVGENVKREESPFDIKPPKQTSINRELTEISDEGLDKISQEEVKALREKADQSNLLQAQLEQLKTQLESSDDARVHRESDLEDEVNALKAKVTELSKLGDQLVNENFQLTESHQQQEIEKDELRKQLHSNEKIDELNRMLTEKDENLSQKQQEMDQLHSTIHQMQGQIDDTKWRLGEHVQWLTDSRTRQEELERLLTEKEEEMNGKQHDFDELNNRFLEIEQQLGEANNRLGEMENGFHEAKNRRDFLEQEVVTMKQHHMVNAEKQMESPTRQSVADEDDLAELLQLSRRKFELESQVSQLSGDLKDRRQRVNQLEKDHENMAKELWIANERVAFLQGDTDYLRNQLNNTKAHADYLQNELNNANQNKLNDSAATTEINHLQEEMRQVTNSLSEKEQEKQKLQWNLGEMTQWWNDAKWRLGEMEDQLSHKNWQFDQADSRVRELEQELGKLEQYKNKAHRALDGSFLIRKQPYVDRYRWTLSMWDENTPDDGIEYRRVWFDIDTSGADSVYLLGSFVNWECGLMCTDVDSAHNKKGVWVDLPPGRYEFRFLVDGLWRTVSHFPTCYNDFGTENNWRVVE